jgi:hypothetical protein
MSRRQDKQATRPSRGSTWARATKAQSANTRMLVVPYIAPSSGSRSRVLAGSRAPERGVKRGMELTEPMLTPHMHGCGLLCEDA